MKGYFSQLIKQTGVALRPAGDLRQSTERQSSVDRGEGGYLAPIHVEDEKTIEPQHGDKTGLVSEATSENSESSAQVNESNDIQYPERGRSDRGLTEGKLIPPSEFERLKQETRESGSEGQKGKVFDMEAQFFAEEVQPRPEAGLRKLSGIEDNVEADTVSKVGSQKLNKFDTSTTQEHISTVPFDTRDKSGDQTDRIQLWQSYLKEVREWVAGETPPGDTSIESIGLFKTGDGEKLISPLPNEVRASASPSVSADSQRMTEEHSVHNFHLSIGTISLTIDEPQKQIQTAQAPATGENTSRKSSGKTQTSRLSRHYIRVR